jgi:hypothetical protein
MAKGPYSRIYHELADDYPEVWDSQLLADFTRLLVAAEQSYPTRAKWTGHAKPRAIARLSAIGLITVEGQRYSVKGMEKERGMRSEKASNAARMRWSDATSNAQGNAPSIAKPMLDETSRDKTRQDQTSTLSVRDGLPNITKAVQEAGEAITGQGLLSAGDAQLTELDRLCETHGTAGVVQGFRALANGKPLSWRQLVWGTMKRLEPIPAALDTRAQREEDEVRAAREASQREYERTKAYIKEMQGG